LSGSPPEQDAKQPDIATPPHSISILTPTYQRWSFLPLLATMIKDQNYPLEKIEWVIIDDSPLSSKEWFDGHPLRPSLRDLKYVHLPERAPIGKKRNLAKMAATGDILVHMDDDDYYAPGYVRYVASIFDKNPEINVAGSTELYFIHPKDPRFYHSGPYGIKHTCGGAMSYRKSYADKHQFNNTAKKAEERSFMQGFTVPIFQIKNIHRINTPLVHSTNTVKKDKVRFRTDNKLYWPRTVRNPAVLFKYLTIYKSHLPSIVAINTTDKLSLRLVRATCLKAIVNSFTLLAQLTLKSIGNLTKLRV
jgi:glycosyltransferase involved in cell wall biosynthesis